MREECEMLASWLLAAPGNKSATAFAQLMEKQGLEYRKGKGPADVRAACKKAMCPCMSQYSTECEVSSCAMYLHQLVKSKREKKVNSHDSVRI